MPELFEGASPVLPLELWLPIPSYEGLYEASSLGRIRSLLNKYGNPRIMIRKQELQNSGYLSLALHRDGKRKHHLVHALVAAAFYGPKPDGCEVNHKDGQKRNNASSNLEYITPDENRRHASRFGLVSRGEDHPFAKLTVEDVRQIRELHGKLLNVEIARRFNISPASVRLIQKRKNWAWVA